MSSRCALCIGNNNYQNIAPLKCAVNDAKQMGNAFRRLGYDVTEAFDLGRYELGTTIYSLESTIEHYDACVFYYAGHGFEIGGQNLLIPVDFVFNEYCSDNELIYNAFPLDGLLEIFNKYPDKAKIIILDACRSTGKTRGSGNGFNPVVSPKGSLIAFSTSPGSVARENDSGNGIYTETLLKYINTDLRVEDLFGKVRKELDKKTNGRQIPWEHTSLLGFFSLYNKKDNKKIKVINFMDSLRVYPEKQTEVISVGAQHEKKSIEVIYPTLEGSNPNMLSKTPEIIRIQEEICSIYESMKYEWNNLKADEYKGVLGNEEVTFQDGIGYEVFLNQKGVFCICINRYLYILYLYKSISIYWWCSWVAK